jgi:hypothetical protein
MINGPVSPLGEAKHPLIGSRRLRIELLPSAPPRRHPALDQRLGLLLVATITSLPHARFSHLQPFAPHGWRAIGPAAAVLVWGFAGWEAVTSLAADFRRPARDLPRATGIALVVIGALYLAIATTSILVLGPKAARTEAPLAELLAIGIGGEVKMVAAGAALLLTKGAMNAYTAGAATLGAALGRDGALPTWFAKGSGPGEDHHSSADHGAVPFLQPQGCVAMGGPVDWPVDTGPRLPVSLVSKPREKEIARSSTGVVGYRLTYIEE